MNNNCILCGDNACYANSVLLEDWDGLYEVRFEGNTLGFYQDGEDNTDEIYECKYCPECGRKLDK